MEVLGSRRRARESSPERGKVVYNMQAKPSRTAKKIQVVYYLTRNGHLEHPHYMEVTHQPLRLRGYVWNDLAENDIIHPAEYVLKGSELLHHQACSEKFQQLQIMKKPFTLISLSKLITVMLGPEDFY